MKNFLILSAVIALAGCAGQNEFNKVRSGDKIQCNYDKFEKVTMCNTGSSDVFYQRVDKKSNPFIAAESYGSAFSYKDAAKDVDGKKLDFEVRGGFVDTMGYVNFPAGYLEKHQDTGIDIRITGRGNTTEIHKTPEEVKEHLNGMKLTKEIDVCRDEEGSIFCFICQYAGKDRANCPPEITPTIKKKMNLG